jgi:hypothetical protein
MKTKLHGLAALVALSFAAESATAQVYSQNIVGYVNTVFNVGDTLFENPLATQNNSDTLANLFSTAPDGTTISLWDATTASFDATSEYTNGNWTIDFTLTPGTGARLSTLAAFTNTFVGDVLDHDGSELTNLNFTLPPVFSGSGGTYLLGDKAPVADTGTNIFLNILGRLPNVGEQITTLDNLAQTYTTSTYLGNGNWDHLPELGVGQAAFLNIGSFNADAVPEPATLALAALGMGLTVWRGRKSLH